AGVIAQAFEIYKTTLVGSTSNLDFGKAMIDAFGKVFQSQSGETVLLRVIMMLLLAIVGYAVQVLYEKQRLASEEGREFVVRQEQLRSAGRLAAEIAHQLKNPLAIINNAVFNLEREVKDSKPKITQQVEMMREEIERADKIITKLMGYAQLSEGRV